MGCSSPAQLPPPRDVGECRGVLSVFKIGRKLPARSGSALRGTPPVEVRDEGPLASRCSLNEDAAAQGSDVAPAPHCFELQRWSQQPRTVFADEAPAEVTSGVCVLRFPAPTWWSVLGEETRTHGIGGSSSVLPQILVDSTRPRKAPLRGCTSRRPDEVGIDPSVVTAPPARHVIYRRTDHESSGCVARGDVRLDEVRYRRTLSADPAP